VVLTILLIWTALCAVAVVFVYCCSLVSHGPRRELTEDEFSAEFDLMRDHGEPARAQNDEGGFNARAFGGSATELGQRALRML
jgi:hypothetical protein